MKQKEGKTRGEMSVEDVFLRRDNLARDIIVVTISIGLAILLTINHRRSSIRSSQESLPQPVAENVEVVALEEIENEAEDPIIDTANWPSYRSNWYGFELKYPDTWNKPVLKGAVKGAKWEYRYQFRKKEADENNSYAGFDVVVYNVGKIKELSNTDEFPTIKNEELKSQGVCEEIAGHMAENEDYPAEQIYISSDDDCYNPAYFYTLTRDNYMYNIVPILADEKQDVIQPEKEIINNLPEFISAGSTFSLIDIVRPKPVPVKPKITAPKPKTATKRDSQGRRVCAKKDDKPSKSSQGKKKHLDMECCLDPDEYPNPHCYYPPKKYGKLLDKLDK